MVKAIDVHAHLFNLNYLPVAAILDHSGFADLPPWLAEAAARAALRFTEDDPSLDLAAEAAVESVEAKADARSDAESMRAALEDFDAYIDALDQSLPANLAEDEELERAALKATGSTADDGRRLRRIVTGIEQSVANGRQKAKWLFAVAIRKERAIAQLLLDTYGADVEIFVHHMMDMKSFYHGGATSYDYYPRQVERMRNLAAAYPDRFITFTAWDPFRDDPDWLDTIKDSIGNRACRGVKVYPPSGYRPVGNDVSNQHPRVVSPSPEEIDRRNVELFRWCASEGVPVFTHCTPEGFQAYKRAGELNASPSWWRALLEMDGMSHLRLCFGHAGGEVWFGTKSEFEAPGSYAVEVLRLCREYEGVCCEFGILDHIQDEDDFELIRDRLGRIVTDEPAFGKKILYGSDWHMLYMHRGHEDFFRNYQRLFGEPALAPHSADFFRNNAVRFLGLGETFIEEG